MNAVTDTTIAIIERLDLIALKLGEANGYLWPKFLLRAHVEFWTLFATMMLFWSTTIVMAILIVRYTDEKNHKELRMFLFPATGVIAFFATIFTFVTIGSIDQIIVPEVWALRDLMRILK